ncbi:MAG: hypothetical protein QUV04_11495 [Synechococcus sp. WH 8007]|nr:hypothetical protein [Synechococcus sp. WH 8007]
MAQRPSPPPSPQARRQAHVLSLRQALSERDRVGVDGLLGQWAHRHGVDGLEPLLQELERDDPEGLSWWRLGAQELEEADLVPEPVVVAEPMAEPVPEPESIVAADPAPAVAPPAPLPMPQEALKRSIRPRPAASRPAPAPSHPALAELRSWLPSAGESRAA